MSETEFFIEDAQIVSPCEHRAGEHEMERYASMGSDYIKLTTRKMKDPKELPGLWRTRNGR